MDLMVFRDIIKDELGNYYMISEINRNKLTLVNAVVYMSFNRFLNEEYVKEIKEQYGETVLVGQPATDMVKHRIELLSKGSVPGSIYSLEEVTKEYKVLIDGLYERNPNV